jgi:hypothetical protein
MTSRTKSRTLLTRDDIASISLVLISGFPRLTVSDASMRRLQAACHEVLATDDKKFKRFRFAPDQEIANAKP